MKRSIKKQLALFAGLSVLSTCITSSAQQAPLRFEAEAYATPTDAWQANKFSNSKWNLWSTDENAKQKWSGGVVLQSPVVKADRKTGEEGAPVLHMVLTDIPSGIYDIYMNGTRAIGVSRDGKKWVSRHGGLLFDEPVKIKNGRLELWFDDRFANVGGVGSCYVDYVELRTASGIRPARSGSKIPDPADYPAVNGWAKTRREEALDRGVVAVRTQEGAYISWRLLKTDPADAGFDVYRQVGKSTPEKRNAVPITRTTDFVDAGAVPADKGTVTYLVCPAGANVQSRGEAAVLSSLGAEPHTAAYVAIKLKDKTTRFQKVAVADLNGDSKLDYIIKYPNGNVDPWVSYWKPSEETYKIEAYLHDGTYLWTRDLGWSIERGIWYSPYVVADLNGDGKAEVAVKTGEGDPREKDGKVRTGPEWLSIWDGMTGKEITKVPWPSREGFIGIKYDYNYFCRNQLAVAYLDGKTPCILALRGTYNLMKADAYQLNGNRLEKLWTYSNNHLARKYWGQGEHYTHALDVDGDGRDEVMLGSVMLDGTGCPLWTTGLGHNDAGYCTDVIPSRPGLEIFYIIETRKPKNGMCVVDARTGEIIWGYDGPTTHVHSAGMCADIDARYAGSEGFGVNKTNPDPNGKNGPWLWSAEGKLLAYGEELPKRHDITTAYWDADLQKECFFGKHLCDFRGGQVDGTISGNVALIGDVLGDWREELITSTPGELRIAITTIPAMDRRVCLLQDPIYRADLRMGSMGYRKDPSLSYSPAARNPNINLTVLSGDKKGACRVVVSAPLKQAVKGNVTLSAGNYAFTPATFGVDLVPGQIKVVEATLDPAAFANISERVILSAALAMGDQQITTRVPAFLPRPPLHRYSTKLPRVEAESFSGEGGGHVKVRTDKTNVSGKAISHWDDKGHWLEWTMDIPKPGASELVIRYCTPGKAIRSLAVDGRSLGPVKLPSTGGFGDLDSDWREHAVKVRLSAGKHVLRLTNDDGHGVNLDFVGYR
jgi:hypothetical protein